MSILTKKKLFFFNTTLFLTSMSLIIGSNPTFAATFTKVEDSLNRIGWYYYENELAGKKMDQLYELGRQPNSVSSKANIVFLPDSESFKITDSSFSLLYMGENTFTNNTDIEQQYLATSFSETITTSSSSNTTKGFLLNGLGVEFNIPLLVGSTKVMTNFNSGTANTTTESKQTTISSGAQIVKVPAHKKYKIEIKLEKMHYSGTVDYTATGDNLKSYIDATGLWIDRTGRPFSRKYSFNYDIEDQWQKLSTQQKNNIKEITIKPNNRMSIDGQAQVSGVIGTRMFVDIFDITNGEKILVSESSAPIF